MHVEVTGLRPAGQGRHEIAVMAALMATAILIARRQHWF